jgi:glycosyltransferase involved in cell wall biosynthesis
MLAPVSIVTVAYDSFFFVRLLVEKVREFVGCRDYEIIAVDRGSRDGTKEWLDSQFDVRRLTVRQWRSSRHRHGEAAEAGVRAAKHERVVLLDSDAHPIEKVWLQATVDQLDDHYRLAGAEFRKPLRDNSYSWYIHPHFMAFFKGDLGKHVVLKKTRGHKTDTGEESTQRVLDAGLGVRAYPLEFCSRFSVGHSRVPTVAAGVFHAWYVTRLEKNSASVSRETSGAVTCENYLKPLQALLRQTYQLDY